MNPNFVKPRYDSGGFAHLPQRIQEIFKSKEYKTVLFFYIQDDLLDEAQAFLASRLDGKADVIKTETLIEAGYFGESISEIFLSRVGNLVILPYRYQSVWWYVEDKFEQKHYGHHGGLTPEEMEIPLFICNF